MNGVKSQSSVQLSCACDNFPTGLRKENLHQFTTQKDGIRQLIFELLRYNNDVKRINSQLAKLLKDLKREVAKLKKECEKIRRGEIQEAKAIKGPLPSDTLTEMSCIEEAEICTEAEESCELEDENECICYGTDSDSQELDQERLNRLAAEKIAKIQATIDEFSKMAKKMHTCRETILKSVQEKAKIFFEQKQAFCSWQEDTLEHIKRCAIKSGDSAVQKESARDIKELQDLFCNECKYVKCCEEQLKELFLMLNVHEEVCAEGSSTSCSSSDSKLDMEWMPRDNYPSQLQNDIQLVKRSMGNALTKAFAAMHMLQPEDQTAFLAEYLLHLRRNEELLQEKCEFFE